MINVTFSDLEATEAIELAQCYENLKAACTAKPSIPCTSTTNVTPVAQTPAAAFAQTPVVPAVPTAAPIAPVPVANTPAVQQPVTQTAQAPTVPIVPTGAPQYTLEMIAKAGTALIDAGKMDLLCNLLTKYQVDALTALDPSQYGNFATELRALGAQI